MSTPAPERLKLLILGLNYAPEMVGIGVYTSGMAEALVQAGHEVRVIAGQPYYPQWRPFPGFSAWRWTKGVENQVRVVRCPHYVPAKPSGFKRLLHHLSFAASALVPTLAAALGQRPDVVIAVAPSLIAAPVARAAAFFCGAKSWLHVQDFEIEAAVATGLVREGLLLCHAPASAEIYPLALHDALPISPKMCERLVEKGVQSERVIELRNWADTDSIAPLDRPSRYREDWGITSPHVALYSGNIANKQGIEIIVDAARLLAHRSDLTFVVCGEGPNRQTLEARAAGLNNIRFHDLQPKDHLNELLGLATVHLMPQLAGAADLVLPSKLGNMFASGRPVVATAAGGTGLAMEVEGCGVVVPPGDAAALAAGVERLIEDSALRVGLGAAARRRAESDWTRSAVLGRLINIVAEGAKCRS